MNIVSATSVAGYQSAIGWLGIGTGDGKIRELTFLEHDPGTPEPTDEIVQLAISQLTEYFQGTRKLFDLPLAPEGSDFEKRVWDNLLKIPYGETTSYREIAKSLGGIRYTRAVGLSNGRNPISIIIPCHRVVGSNGSLTGYGGGLWRKKWLLDHEAKVSGRPVQMDFFDRKA